MPSVLRIICPQCNSGLRLRNKRLLGRHGVCPKCNNRFLLEEPVKTTPFPKNGKETTHFTASKDSLWKKQWQQLNNTSDNRSPNGKVHDSNLTTSEEIFHRLKEIAKSYQAHTVLKTPLSEWLEPGDSCYPFKYLSWNVQDVLDIPFEHIQASWATSDRLKCLLTLLERAIKSAESRTGVKDESILTNKSQIQTLVPESQFRQLNYSASIWRSMCEVIKRHNLEELLLGTIAPSLSDIPSSLWRCPLSQFTSLSYRQLSEIDGSGPQKVKSIYDVFRALVMQISLLPSETHLSVSIFPKKILEVANWIDCIVTEQRIPDTDEIAHRIIRPIIKQIENDLSPEIASICKKRLGFDGEPITLEEIANQIGKTRERVRQLATKANNVLAVRWPQGEFQLSRLIKLLKISVKAENQVIVVQSMRKHWFGVEDVGDHIPSEVLSKWKEAGRQKQTPLNEDDVLKWLANKFPNLIPQTGLNWISKDSLSCDFDASETLYFSNEPLDQLLFKLYTDIKALPISEVVKIIDGDERSVLGKISRDPRFIICDNNLITASIHFPLKRIDGVWNLQLTPRNSASPSKLCFIQIEDLAKLIVGGMLQIGISDATIWGVHRYSDEILSKMYDAVLPSDITPVVLQDLLVSHSHQIISRMRRRRLRWKCADGTVPVRGKLGWMSFVVVKKEMAVTLDELRDLLHQYYQDYADYIFSQLNIDSGEDGESEIGFVILSEVRSKIPTIIVPHKWKYDPQSENISEEVKLISSKIISMATKGRLAKADLSFAPWLIELVENNSYGKKIWDSADELIQHQDSQSNDLEIAEPHETPQSNGGAETMNNNQIDDLLSNFF